MPRKKQRSKAQAKSWYPDPALVRKRVKEMNRAYRSSFPNAELPNNGLGRKWARYMMRTKRLYPGPLDYLWLKTWCPWMTETEQDEVLGLKGHWYSTKSLGERLEIENALRKDLRLWTMRPNDVEWEEVQSETEQRKYLNRKAKRRASGVKARRKGVAEPWKARGMTRATYYRKKPHLPRETPESPVTFPVGSGDSRVSPSKPNLPARRGGKILVMPERDPVAQRKPHRSEDRLLTPERIAA
jgi:hypothetical protein